MKPTLPYESGILGEGVLGDMTLGEDYTRTTELIGQITPRPVVLIEQYTAAFVLCGVIDNYEQFEYTENWYDLDTWTITINRYKSNVSAFVTGGYIRFYADGKEHIGTIESIEKPLDQDGKGGEAWVISGRGVESIFAQRICLTGTTTGTGYNTCGDTAITALTFTFAATATVTASASCLSQVSPGYYIYNSTNDAAVKAVKIASISADGLTITLTTAYAGTAGSGKSASLVGQPGETALRTYVNAECISATDTNRNLSGVTLATADSKRGAVVARSTRFEYLSDILYGVAKETNLSFRLVHGAGLNFIFTVLQGSDVSGTVTITPGYGNVKTLKYIESLLEMKNLLYMGGTGDAAARVVRECYDVTEPAGWSRREKFIDASDCTTDALLDAKGAETLATTKESVSLEVEYLESPTYTLNTHFKLGDIITVLFEDVATMASRIISITYSWDAGGKHVKLGVGKEAPDLVSILKLDRKLSTAQGRR